MEKIKIASANLPLCDHCLGRIYSMLGHGLRNDERGRAIRVLYSMENNLHINTLYPQNCDICNNIFSRLEKYAKYIATKLEEYEYSTFMIGSRFSKDILEKEKKYQEKYGSYGEPINREFNRELGKILMKITGKEATIKDPDITIIVDTEYDDISLEFKPLLIYGRYRKLIRGIPQTKWPSGKYKESIEEIIAQPIMEIVGGTGHALHGMGREDIDARMLGNGRPFIIEIKNPKKRTLNLEEITHKINSSGKVEVLNLRFASKKDIVELKKAEPKKRYRVGIKVATNEKDLRESISSLIGIIYQRTPIRVRHRRSDKIRKKEVYEIKLIGKDQDIWILEILAESGTYIKELMHGDSGRTSPSLAEILNKSVEVVWLDVIEILDKKNHKESIVSG